MEAVFFPETWKLVTWFPKLIDFQDHVREMNDKMRKFNTNCEKLHADYDKKAPKKVGMRCANLMNCFFFFISTINLTVR